MLSSWNTLLVGMQAETDIEENTCQFLIKVNVYLQCDPATLLLGICPRELKTYVHLKTLDTNFYSSSINTQQILEIA